MKKLLFGIMAVAALSGCATSLKAPVTGFFYSDLRGSDSVTSNQAGSRVGESCATSILGLVGTGDASIETARRNGGITMISEVDNSLSSILGIYAKYCTIVRGR